MRFVFAFLVFGSALLFAATVEQMKHEKRYAFVIANGVVSETEEDSAVKAAKTMEAYLTSKGFVTTTAYNQDRSGLIKTFRAFDRSIKPNSVIAVVYAGKVITYDNQTWLLPAEMELEGLDQLRLSALSLNFLLTKFQRHVPRVTMALIDAYKYSEKANKTTGIKIVDLLSSLRDIDVIVQGHTDLKVSPMLTVLAKNAGNKTKSLKTLAKTMAQKGADTEIAADTFYFNVPSKILTPVDKAWRRAVDKNSVVGYEAFLIAFPDARYKQTAIDRIDKLNARRKGGAAAGVSSTAALAQERKFQEKTEALKKMEAKLKAQQAALASLKAQQSAVSQAEADAPAAVAADTLYMEPVEMVTVPAGVYLMGSDAFENAKPVHMVKIEKPFKMSAYEVTNKEYAYFIKATGAKYQKRKLLKNESASAVYVSWEDATRYAQWLSEMTGKHYRLPTEAEWEYAARAGSDALYSWGDNPALAPQYAWMAINAHGFVRSGGLLQPNAFGLYDTAGNVAEWCIDAMKSNYNGAPSVSNRAVEDPDAMKVFRGGSYTSEGEALSPSYRNSNIPTYRSKMIGFRLVEGQ